MRRYMLYIQLKFRIPNSVLPFKGLNLIRCYIIVIIESLKIFYKKFSDVLKII